MVARFSLIAAFVISCDAGHFLLLAIEVQAVHVLQKPPGLITSESRRVLAAMFDHYISILRVPESETQIAHFATIAPLTNRSTTRILLEGQTKLGVFNLQMDIYPNESRKDFSPWTATSH